MELILRILCCALAGVGCGLVSRVWAARLQERRGLAPQLAEKTERVLSAAMAVPGGALGALTTGTAMPACGLALLTICGTVSVIDWTHRIIPNQAVLAVLGLKLLSLLPASAGVAGVPAFGLLSSLAGLAGCFVLFLLPGFFGKNVGAGDLKLAAAMGFLLGLRGALVAVLVMGLLVLGYSIVQKQMPMLRFLKTNIPMGPFIAAGMLVSFLGADLLL